MNLKSASIILLVTRIMLGLTFALSGIGKILNSGDATYLIELVGYELFWVIEFKPEIIAVTITLELLLAVLLLLGKWVRKVFIVSVLLLFILTGILFYIWLQGHQIESCGCFGGLSPYFLSGFTGTFIKNAVLSLIALAGWISKTYILDHQGHPDSKLLRD